MTYQCRYIRSSHFKRNLSAQRVVTNEFGTAAATAGKAGGVRALRRKLDVSSLMSDNTFITIYPVGGRLLCFYESPFVHQIDPGSLETVGKIDLNK